MKKLIRLAMSICFVTSVAFLVAGCYQTIPRGRYLFESLKIDGVLVTEGPVYDFHSHNGFTIGGGRIMGIEHSLDTQFRLEGEEIWWLVTGQTWQFSDMYFRDGKIVLVLPTQGAEITFARVP